MSGAEPRRLVSCADCRIVYEASARVERTRRRRLAQGKLPVNYCDACKRVRRTEPPDPQRYDLWARRSLRAFSPSERSLISLLKEPHL
jgi:hypothetical protein